jgi:hypothetical protein
MHSGATVGPRGIVSKGSSPAQRCNGFMNSCWHQGNFGPQAAKDFPAGSGLPLEFRTTQSQHPPRILMNISVPLLALALISSAASAQVPKVFQGFFEKGVAVRGEIGMIEPPQEIDRYVAKVSDAARLDPKWFEEYSALAKPGAPLAYHEKLGLTQEEYADYLKLWGMREFKGVEDVLLLLRENAGGTWTLTSTGEASTLSTLRYHPATDVFTSPNGELGRIEDIDASADSILGAWKGPEWRFEEETALGRTKENFALGRLAGDKFGIVVYRFQEVSSEGTRLIDKSLVVRFALGKAGHLPERAQAPLVPGAPGGPAAPAAPGATPKAPAAPAPSRLPKR